MSKSGKLKSNNSQGKKCVMTNGYSVGHFRNIQSDRPQELLFFTIWLAV